MGQECESTRKRDGNYTVLSLASNRILFKSRIDFHFVDSIFPTLLLLFLLLFFGVFMLIFCFTRVGAHSFQHVNSGWEKKLEYHDNCRGKVSSQILNYLLCSSFRFSIIAWKLLFIFFSCSGRIVIYVQKICDCGDCIECFSFLSLLSGHNQRIHMANRIKYDFIEPHPNSSFDVSKDVNVFFGVFFFLIFRTELS